MITIKDFDYTQEQYAALVAINAPIWPERPLTIADFEHEDKGKGPDKEKYAQRWLAEVDGNIVGHGQAVQDWQRQDVSRYFILSEVLPTFRRQGVGRALYAQLLATLNNKPSLVFATDTMEDREETITWLQRREFVSTHREPMSALAVQAFDAGKFAKSADKTAAANIHITITSQLETSDPSYKPKLFDLIWEIITDVPGSNAEKREKPGYDYLEQVIMGDPTYTPDAYFVAVEQKTGNFVGMCNVHPKVLDGHWNNGLTGVLRSHRRMGIATTLKLAAIAHVKANGGIEIGTSNEENNPMYGLNMALGFEPRPAILNFERTFE